MKPNVLLPVVAIAFAVSAGVYVWLIQTYVGGADPLSIFMGATIVTQMCMMMAVLALLPALIGALIPVRLLAWISAGGAVVFGFLGALYSEMMTLAAMRAVGPVSFAVTAPGRAEALLCLSLGLFVALAALGLLKLRGR